MFKRLGVGLLKGLVIGGAIGAGLHFGLHLPVVGALLGYLAAMASGATAAVLAGKAPWRGPAVPATSSRTCSAAFSTLVARLPIAPPTATRFTNTPTLFRTWS